MGKHRTRVVAQSPTERHQASGLRTIEPRKPYAEQNKGENMRTPAEEERACICKADSRMTWAARAAALRGPKKEDGRRKSAESDVSEAKAEETRGLILR